MPDQNVTNNAPKGPSLWQRAKAGAFGLLPQGMQKGITSTRNWLSTRNLHPGSLLLGSALTGYFAGDELAQGRSLGGVIGENAGFWAGNQGFQHLMKKLPNFTGKGPLSFVGSFLAGIPASMAAGALADKYTPIHRFTSPTMEQYGARLMQKTSARIAREYNYRRY